MALLLVDLDGTIRKPLSGEQYFQHPKDQVIIAGADCALQSYSEDWMIVGITNQGGVAAGHKSMQTCVEEQQYTLELFPQLKEIYFCPDFAGKKCFRVTAHNAHNHSKTHWSGQFRKPGAGMLLLAIARHQQSAQNVCYVGDRPEDETAAKRAKVQFQWAEDWIKQRQSITERL